MLPRLLLGAAALSAFYFVLAHERRTARVRRLYRFDDAAVGFDVVADVITREFERFGVESKLEQTRDTALVRTSRRGHAAIVTALLAGRAGVPIPALA